MQDQIVLAPKSEGLLRKKQWICLLIDLLIAVFGVTSLYVKFFLIDGVIAFRAFTIDGNLYTTILSVISLIMGIVALASRREPSTKLYMFWLASAVSEAVIFIINMMGYLPFVADVPQVSPYHMFCLHVGIPILAVARFIIFEKPIGVLKPTKLLAGAIPIGIYGFFVVIAIKTGVLLSSLVPYSFLDFQNNYIWYFLFALFFIPGFGYVWSKFFYRLNLKAASLWYKKEDVTALHEARRKAATHFKAVNSGIAIVFCLLAILLLSCSLMTNSNTSTTVQNELMSTVSALMLGYADKDAGPGLWSIKDGKICKGETVIADANDPASFHEPGEATYNTSYYMRASDLPAELAAKYQPGDYVCVKNYTWDGTGPRTEFGAVLEQNIVDALLSDEGTNSYFETVKVQRELTEEEQQMKEQLRNTKESYYRFLMIFSGDMDMYDPDPEGNVAVVEMYIPMWTLTQMIKDAEFSSDFFMAVVIIIILGILFIISFRWIKSLESAHDFLKTMAKGEIPEKPLDLGKKLRGTVMAEELNAIREQMIERRK